MKNYELKSNTKRHANMAATAGVTSAAIMAYPVEYRIPKGVGYGT